MGANLVTHRDVDGLPGAAVDDSITDDRADCQSAAERAVQGLGMRGRPQGDSPRGAASAVSRYDFKKSARVGQDVLAALNEIHTAFAGELACSLSTLARTAVDVKPLGPEQLTTRDFLGRLDMPTCLSVLRVEPLPGAWLFDIQPAVLYPLLDCLLGGSCQAGPVTTRRSLTDVELRLVRRISDLLCHELRAAWRSVADLRIETQRIENNPRAAKVAAADEPAVMLRFGIGVGPRRGLMRLCCPVGSLEAIRGTLAVRRGDAVVAPAVPENVEQIEREVRSSQTQVTVWLAESQITAQELLGLRVGDIITTQKSVQEPVVVAVGDVAKFQAQPGTVRGRKAVVITAPLTQP